MHQRASFDSLNLNTRIERILAAPPQFGMERNPHHTYLKQIVPERMFLTRGYHIINSGLHFREDVYSSVQQEWADFNEPSVLVALTHARCTDRANDAGTDIYVGDIGTLFAMHDATGRRQIEHGYIAGGILVDPRTLAYVTVSHAEGETVIERINQNPESYILYSADIQTHVGVTNSGRIDYGKTREDYCLDERPACGAIIGALTHFSPENPVHQGVREALGEQNYALLSGKGVAAKTGEDITFPVAAAIIAARGMLDLAEHMNLQISSHSGRGLAHITSSVTFNRTARDDTVALIARAIVFQNGIRTQGLGLDAAKYEGTVLMHHGEQRLLLSYQQ